MFNPPFDHYRHGVCPMVGSTSLLPGCPSAGAPNVGLSALCFWGILGVLRALRKCPLRELGGPTRLSSDSYSIHKKKYRIPLLWRKTCFGFMTEILPQFTQQEGGVYATVAETPCRLSIWSESWCLHIFEGPLRKLLRKIWCLLRKPWRKTWLILRL